MVLAEAGNYSEASRCLERSIKMRPSQYRAWGLLASVYLNQHADAAKVRETYLKAIELAADLRKETPRDSYLLADVGSYYAATREGKGESAVARAGGGARTGRPEVLYQVAIGYESLHTAPGACGCLH